MISFRLVICGASLVLSALDLTIADGKGEKFAVPGYMKQEQTIDKAGLARLSKVPFFKSTKLTDLHISAFVEREDGILVDVISKTSVYYGGHRYPANVRVEGESNLLYVYLGKSNSVTVNGIKICGQLGQHAQTLEIFEVKLCDDLILPEGVIPAGSKIDFSKGLPTKEIKFSDIRCMVASKPTTLKGRPVQSEREITPNYDRWYDPDRGCLRGGD